MANEKNVFEEFSEDASISDDATTATTSKAPEMVQPDEYTFGELSDNEVLDTELKPEDVNRTFVINKAEMLKPVTKDQDGNAIPMEAGKNGGKEHYKSKLKITFNEGIYVSYVPNIKWYKQTTKDGKKVLSPWFYSKPSEEDLNNAFMAEISKLYFRYCKAFGFEVGKLSPQAFVNGLVGKKVKLKQYKAKNPINQKMGYRLDIAEFILN